MSREILFRGKQSDNGEWVYGDLMTKYPHHKGLTIVENGCIYHEVDPETVGQYTNLKDKNGVKIFEGDILGFHDIGERGVVEVEFDDGAFRVDDWGEKVVLDDDIIQSFNTVRIEGNKWDNPELLEV